MHAKFACGVRCRRDNAAFVALPSHDYGLAFERRVEEFFHGDEEGVHIDVKDGAGESRQLRGDGHLRIVTARRGNDQKAKRVPIVGAQLLVSL
jgi:hypothetical protein